MSTTNGPDDGRKARARKDAIDIAIWTGILLCLAVAVTLMGGCSTEPIHPRQDEAVDLVAETYLEYGLSDPRPVAIIWYVEQQCIPSPFDPDHDTRCRTGRTFSWDVLDIGIPCQVEVVWRNQRLSATSFAHELLHCSIVDRKHQRPEWYTALPAAIDRLWADGL